MATSGTYSFTVNRDQIIRTALLVLGKLDESELPSAQETTDMALLLNMLMKQWQGKADFAPGLKMFSRRHGHLFLSPTTGQYTVGPAAQGWANSYTQTTTSSAVAISVSVLPLTSTTGMAVGDNIGVLLSSGAIQWTTITVIAGLHVTLATSTAGAVSNAAQVITYTTTAQQPVVVETAFLRDAQGSDTPLKIMTVQEYDLLPSKAQSTFISDPTAIYYENQKTNGVLHTDCAAAQDMTKHICLTYMEAVQDVNAASDEVSYPQEWYLALVYGLAKLAAPIFTVPWTQVMAENAATSLAIAQKKDGETSTMFFQSAGVE
jgi:hypothetical protein